MIHREGIPTIIITLLVAGLVVFSALYFTCYPIVHFLAYAIAAFLLVLVLQFFRNPKRHTTLSDLGVIAPCDGKVVVIEETTETEYFKDKRIQVSIFMSPINVHVNRNPISGIVKYVKYHPGKYLVAWHPKSSTENERSTIVIENQVNKQEVLFRQIAGFLARRIVFYSKEGDKAVQGAEFGFIKFGSRVDLFFPIGTDIKVKIDDVVKGGITSIAELK
ncbi:MAG: phosphatidylserine decarboxylase family protein [Bacteroidetes bacterium]|nr:phosphatidylserine decarboxylase family protein [Bacteroidota bacterium]